MSDKMVFVTVGTTKFDNLITTVLSPTILEVVHVITILFIFISLSVTIDYLFYIILYKT